MVQFNASQELQIKLQITQVYQKLIEKKQPNPHYEALQNKLGHLR